jgi:O-antigen/teichoic acid export membrane protein
VTLAPWDYLLQQFSAANFQDLFWPIVLASLLLLVGQVVLYNVRTRQLHRYEPLVTMQEWLLWTGICTFSLILIEALFVFYFLFVLVTILLGVACYLWIRFRHWPPEIEAYNMQLRRSRFFSQARYKHPEATIRSRNRRRRRR